jgi:hypothetical protein
MKKALVYKWKNRFCEGHETTGFFCTKTPAHNYIIKHSLTDMEHPPYFPDLSPPDFFLFLRSKSNPKG